MARGGRSNQLNGRVTLRMIGSVTVAPAIAFVVDLDPSLWAESWVFQSQETLRSPSPEVCMKG
jgi:hypothetical protein